MANDLIYSHRSFFNLILNELFGSFQPGGGFRPLRSFQNIKAIMTVKLGTSIVRTKLYLLLYVTWDDDVIRRGNYAIMSKQPRS